MLSWPDISVDTLYQAKTSKGKTATDVVFQSFH